jgi:hypothetical protein
MYFNGNNHDLLTLDASPSFSPLFRAANIRLIHLYTAMKAFPTRSNHGTPQLV